MRLLSRKVRWPAQLLQRVDKIAADINIVLVVIAVGLATLDMTFLVTQKIIERLPQVTRVVQDPAPTVETQPPAMRN